MQLIISLLAAGIAGWLAGKIMDCNGNILRNVILGCIGGFVGSILLGLFGLYGRGFVGSVIVGVIGSCIVIWLSNLLTLRRP